MLIEQLYDALKEAGASEDKAREAARAVAHDLVTKEHLDLRLAETRQHLDVRLAETRQHLDVRFAELKSELELRLAEVKSELELRLADVKSELIKWVAGMLIAQAAVIAALTKLL